MISKGKYQMFREVETRNTACIYDTALLCIVIMFNAHVYVTGTEIGI